MKTLKKALFLLMTLISLNTFSQTIGDYIDVVHLKNGSVIKGVMIEQVPGQSIKIRTNDGSEYVYQVTEITKFTREESFSSSTANLKEETTEVVDTNKVKWLDNFKQKKNGHFIEIDALFNSASTGLRITNGIKFGRFGMLGLAVGMERIRTGLYSAQDIPVASLNLVYSGELFNKRITPFYQVEVGYGVALERRSGDYYGYPENIEDFPIVYESSFLVRQDNLYYGGPMVGMQLGFKFKTKRKIQYKLGLDARIVSSYVDMHYGNQKISTFSATPGLGVRFGIGF